VVGRDPLALALPLATRPSYCARAIACLAERFSVITWEARLVLEPEVRDRRAGGALGALDRCAGQTTRSPSSITWASSAHPCSGIARARRRPLHLAASHRRRFTRLVLASGAYFLNEDQCEHTQYEHDIAALAPLVAGDRAGAGQLFDQFFAGNAVVGATHEFASEIYRPYDDVESFYRFNVCIDNFMRGRRAVRRGSGRRPALVASGGRDEPDPSGELGGSRRGAGRR